MRLRITYTYWDANGREYFVQRAPVSGYGVYSAIGRRTPKPEVTETFDTAEEAQARLDQLAMELKLCAA
ncbi:hypothetical protein [Cloacibacillus sp. An23]|uniref:hypothetical protein n=1 Tax=Cloacibacillus sp. An23 TaxID=1965591 RepID=UPI000B39C717|nr:hypothetical protein [Cloacibacillus sp. An23]OUO94784.1 hypothetical protein B5F39_02635 [Cloacibacillus sp. An23]